jgi:hypothetical protein
LVVYRAHKRRDTHTHTHDIYIYIYILPKQCKALQVEPAHLSLMHVYQLLLRRERERAGRQQKQQQQSTGPAGGIPNRPTPLTNMLILSAWADLNDLLYIFEVRGCV